MKRAVWKGDGDLGELKAGVVKVEFAFEGEAWQEGGPEDDSDTAPSRSRWSRKGLGRVATRSELSDPCLVPPRTKPRFGNKEDVYIMVMYKAGYFATFLSHVISLYRPCVKRRNTKTDVLSGGVQARETLMGGDNGNGDEITMVDSRFSEE